VVADAEKEEDLIRKALSKIYEIRVIRHERRIQVISQESKLGISPNVSSFCT
jgi:hypothetical protein